MATPQSGATFEDYLRTATMAEISFPPEPPKKQGGFQSKSLKNKIWIVAVAVLSANIGGWIAKTAFHAARSSLKTDTSTFGTPMGGEKLWRRGQDNVSDTVGTR